ncbi:MAG: hypothetical protein JXA14_22880 [Anaerolineae bacterium]|nr:hypothetical protein [Anaerolineae bacterium]
MSEVLGRSLKTHYHVVAHRPLPGFKGIVRRMRQQGVSVPNWMLRKIWEDDFENLVVNEGLDDSLDKHLKGSSYTAAWYMGLTDGTPSVAAGDTMASHAGWTEVTAYDEAVRQTVTFGSVSSQSVDNSGSPCVFTIDTNSTTIGGAFLVTNSTKGGSTGTLYGGGAFTAGDKTLDDNDTLTVTVTCTASAS